MSTPNIPGETPENLVQKPKNVNIHGLLKSALEREFGTPIDGTKFDSYKKRIGAIQEGIQAHMQDLRSENGEDWSHVTDDMIKEEAQKDIIIERLNHMAMNLIFRRTRAFDRVLEVLPQVSTETNGEGVLRSGLARLNENELHNMIVRKATLSRFVYGLFPSLQGVSMADSKKFDSVFPDKDAHFDDVGKKRVERVFMNYTKYNQTPDDDDLSFILAGYKDASEKRKKEILTDLGVNLTIRDAYHEFGLIDDSFLEAFAKKEWEEFYVELTAEKKKSFLRSLSYNQSQVLTPKDFSLTALSHIFSDEKKRAKVSTEISRTIGMDVPEKNREGGNDVLSEIRREKKEKAERRASEDKTGQTLETETDYDIHEAFVEKMETSLRNNSGLSRIEHIEKLKKAGSVIQFTHEENGVQFVKLERFQDENGFPIETAIEGEYGVELRGYGVANVGVLDQGTFRQSYDNFAKFLADQKDMKVLSAPEFEALLTKDVAEASKGEKIFDARTVESDPVTATNIATKLDLLDSGGSAFGFETGTCFVAPSHETETGKSSSDEIWRVEKVHGDMVDLMDAGGHTLAKNLSLSDVYTTLSQSDGFKRISKIPDDTAMAKELVAFGLSSDAVLEDGKLFQKLKDDHGHEQKKTINCFQGEKDGHIRIESLKNGMVRFGEYSEKIEVDKLRKHAEKKGEDKVVKSYYDWKTLSYPAFLAYLGKQKLKATTKDPVVPDATHNVHEDHHHAPHAHMEGSFLKRIMMMQNPASIWKGFEMIYHSIEHTLEKGAKLDAARFAMGTADILGLPDSVSAQIYADIVDGSKEIIEKYEKKIFGLPGPRGREKCIHIVHNKDSRPEEVISAMNYMLKSYGHLYAEDIKHFQSKVTKQNIATADPGYFAFLDAFILSAKLPGGINKWRIKAYEKAIGEMGTLEDHEGEPTEEQLIHALFKNIDGNWGDFPYAASVVKGMGGPSGFEKNWKMEGYDNAYKKGKDQTQMVNAQGRLNKAVGYFNTHEIYKAIGAMEMVTAKVKDPDFQAMPFIWAVGGYSRHASHTALQKLKGYAENGYSFHAYSFLRNEDANTVYRETVRKALIDLAQKGKIKSSALSEFNNICARLENGPEDQKITDSKYNKLSPAVAMMKFWQTYQGAGLHDMLQGHNGWLVEQSKTGDATIKNYISKLEGAHSMQLNDGKVPSNELGKDWHDEHGLRTSRIWEMDTNTGLRSLKRTLSMVNVGRRTGDFVMQKEIHDKLWNGAIEQVNKTRDAEYFGNNKALQKEQFLAYRDEIIDHFRGQLGVSTGANIDMNKMLAGPFDYWEEMRAMGIDPRSIFEPDFRVKNADTEYDNWINNRRSEGGFVRNSIPKIEDMVRGNSDKVINSPQLRKNIKPGFRKTGTTSWQDDDAMNKGGAADISDNSKNDDE